MSSEGWVFGPGLDDNTLAILAFDKTHIYRYFLGVELRRVQDLVWRRTLSRNWADYDEDMNPGTDNDFTVVKTKKRRRESSNSPTAAAPSSNSGGARTSRRLQSSARSVPRAQEIPTTRAHITEARARQASSSEEHCVYL
ncbi:hypothetical protein LAZ67_18000770 [Cordylochernes scorpioides]|uniref:Uncharacterized protein n=1 Tax=Cordylochernes scorpioides TaxID=51811 RepID=A0ABY6LF63_9ARAC|nr:hypothetical protein LAZ67_18000770 [Cordylochernes scorpioides]